MISFKEKIDLKWVFIFVLSFALILSFVFRKDNNIDDYKTQKEELAKDNERLKKHFDSLVKINIIIDNNRKLIADSLIMTKTALNQSNNKINKLEKRLYENSKNINGLNANGVASEFTNILNTKGNNNN